jgi:YbbR domain-containing protein
MWKRITESKWFYIVLSILLAFILWIYVGKEANPLETGNLRGVQVVFSGLEKLEERGLMISEGEEQTVTLGLQARRDVFNRLDNESVTVTVDLSSITEPGEYSLTYRIDYPRTVTNDAIQLRSSTPEKITVTVSLWASKQVEVRGVFTGSVAEGYQKGEFSFAPDTVTVSGQEELVSQVSYVQVTVNQEDLSSTYSQETPFVFMDYSGNPIVSDGLETDTQTILVTLPVVQLKEIPLTVDLIPGGGVTDTNTQVEVTIEPESIIVSGGSDDLEALKELNLGSIELYKVFGTDTLTFPIQLSNELTNVSGIAEATVTVKIRGLATKTLEVDNIEIINKPDGYTVEPVTQTRSVQIRGTQEAVDAVLPTQLRIVADLKDITPAVGSQTVPVKVYLDGSSDVGVVGDYNIVISIQR